jgi:hypothetical protein
MSGPVPPPPSIVTANGSRIIVSGTPVAGQVPTADGPNAAHWAAGGGGGGPEVVRINQDGVVTQAVAAWSAFPNGTRAGVLADLWCTVGVDPPPWLTANADGSVTLNEDAVLSWLTLVDVVFLDGVAPEWVWQGSGLQDSQYGANVAGIQALPVMPMRTANDPLQPLMPTCVGVLHMPPFGNSAGDILDFRPAWESTATLVANYTDTAGHPTISTFLTRWK